MSKRELGALAMDVDVGGPRAKRRKDTVTFTMGANEVSGVSSHGTATNREDVEMVEASGGSGQDSASVKELGLRVWHTVREAVNKDNIIPSPAFMRLPPKRVYPDYYTIISQPICLEDIKKRLDTAKYHTFDELKADFDLCFNNAKEYNLKGSSIWEDAKFLQKLAHKEVNRITGKKEKKGKKEDRSDEHDEDEDDDKKKNKPPNMKRLLKARLQKLVEKTNDEGRILSTAFMELPSKKLYPSYYTTIKKPQAFERIFKHLERKEYSTANDFAADVELVFSNALIFNQEHSQIWEDAGTLRDYFHQLMSDLPAPYTLPQYSKPTIGKLKLKVPAPSTGATSSLNTSSKPAVPTITLRVPAPSAKSPEQKSSASPSSKTEKVEIKAPLTKAVPTEAPPAKAASTKAAPAKPPSPVKAQPTKLQPTKPPTVKSPSTATPSTPAVSASTPNQPAQFKEPPAKPTAPPATAPPPKPAPKSTPKPAPALTPIAAPVPIPASAPRKAATPSVPPPTRPASQQPVKPATPVQAPPKVLPYSTAPQFSSHYPNATYQRPQLPATTPAYTPTQSQAQVVAPAQQPVIRTPPPSLDGRRPLKWVCLTTRPRGRAIILDNADGVRSWALTLGQGERSLTVAGITFLEEEGDEDGGAEDNGEVQVQKQVAPQAQEEEEEEEEEEPVPKKRKRGRPPRNAAKVKAAAPAPTPAPVVPEKAEKPARPPKTSLPTPENVQVLLNGSAVGHQAGQQGLWMMDLQVGSNVVEVGEKDGHTWKVYLERL